MGVDEFQLTLNTPPYHIFRPGDLVVGNVKLVTSPDVDLSEGMTITLYGNANVEWRERNGQTTITYTGYEELFENSLVHSCTHEQTMYPFSMQIPNTPALPWTTSTTHGKVEYGVKAVVKRPWYKLGNKKRTLAFSLNSHLNSRIAASSKNGDYYNSTVTSKSDETNAGCCCIPFCCWYLFSREKINLMLTIESLWTYPGQELPFTLEVDNTKTGRPLGNAKIQLVGSWLHLGRCAALIGDGISKVRTEETIVKEDVLPMSLSPGDQLIKKGVIKVPMDVIPTQTECSILKFAYKLRGIMDEIGGFTCMKIPATVEVDVLIGTLGGEDVFNSYQ